jgi:hypothetical protein
LKFFATLTLLSQKTEKSLRFQKSKIFDLSKKKLITFCWFR